MKDKWGKIAYAVRHGGAVDPRFSQCWTKFLLTGMRPGDRVLDPVIELPQHYAAEALAESFLKGPADTIMYIDDDMTFEPQHVWDLRDNKKGQEYDILQALCLSRSTPHRAIIYEPYTGTDPNKNFTLKAVPEKDTVVDVAFAGLGFTMIRRSVFERLAKTKNDDEMYFYWGRKGDSEDAMFGQDAVKAGCKVGVLTSVCVGHRIKVEVTWDHKKQGVAYVEHCRAFGRALKGQSNEKRKDN